MGGQRLEERGQLNAPACGLSVAQV
uniref:Uncharacterized protein n=1 Tax=Anguilla anguilla TaxID=7936 RepID=A0A0E9QF44_ANGAN